MAHGRARRTHPLSLRLLKNYTLGEFAQKASRRTLGPAMVRLTADRRYDLAETLVVANPKQDIARLAGAWGKDETDALRAAIAAIEKLPGG